MVLISWENTQKLLEALEHGRVGFKAFGSEQEGYTAFAGVEAEYDSAKDVVQFYNEHIKDKVAQEPQVYGSSPEAIKEVAESDSSAMYGKKEGDMKGEWAVDVSRLLESDEVQEDSFESAINRIASINLATVSLAYADSETGHDRGFYSDLIGDLEGDFPEPVQIPVEEETEGLEEEQELNEQLHEVQTPYDEEILRELGLDPQEIDEEGLDIVHEKMLSGTIEEAKQFIEDIREPDYDSLLEAEKRGKNRSTLKRYLKKEMEEETEEDF